MKWLGHISCRIFLALLEDIGTRISELTGEGVALGPVLNLSVERGDCNVEVESSRRDVIIVESRAPMPQLRFCVSISIR